ncbi:FtsX-like permease family protein [Ruminococcus sp.]|uniref:FtsX-like permease family protein n=1 Tax=Ruminococcus sp. TaxID=41978 RepID=UPI003F105584
MHIRHCARIAAYTISGKKRHALHVFLNILLITCTLVIWLVLTASLGSAQDAYISGTLSSNVEYMTLNVDRNGQLVQDQQYNRYRTIAGWQEIAPPVIAEQVNLPEVLGREDWLFVNNRFVTLMLDGQAYQGINDYSYDFFADADPDDLPAVPFSLSVVYTDHVFSENDLSEFAYRYPDAAWLLQGTGELKEGELLISDYMLGKFGLSGDPAGYIGKQVSFLVEGEPLPVSYRLAGVIHSGLFRCSGLMDMPQIYVRGDPQTTRFFQIETPEARLPIRSYDHITDVLLRLGKQGVGLSYFSWMRAKYAYNINAIHLIIQRLMSVFELLVLLAVVINLYRILSEAADKQCSQYGMLRAIGMPVPAVCLISYMELLFYLLLSVVFSLFLSYSLLALLNRVIYGLIHVQLALSVEQYLYIGAGALAGLFVLFVLLNTLLLFRYIRCSPVQLLHGKTERPHRARRNRRN